VISTSPYGLPFADATPTLIVGLERIGAQMEAARDVIGVATSSSRRAPQTNQWVVVSCPSTGFAIKFTERIFRPLRTLLRQD